MKIKLDYYLKRKRITLQDFLKINNLTSYKDLLEFCNKRNFIPVDEKELAKLNESKKKNKSEPTSGKTSKTQKKKSSRPGIKNKSSSQNVSFGDDKKQNWRMEHRFNH